MAVYFFIPFDLREQVNYPSSDTRYEQVKICIFFLIEEKSDTLTCLLALIAGSLDQYVRQFDYPE